eukprot:gnl/MRDRNA2_/MRDRNA2_159580_c0_seq1.p1 gnl/MRDRNA2_/MRDRNA2_159580_c0~~gnl/MRDRNA2_/MRDRNA2_159580_c0_seq1.p1  ORF type:complete len:778 (-),score=156.39 gnl/MRDRNA2_/MRDRNA2_159580_c0_seq1:54-2387(-)
MSAKQLRRLQEQREREKKAEAEAEQDNSTEDVDEPLGNKPKGGFSAFAFASSSESEAEDGTEDKPSTSNSFAAIESDPQLDGLSKAQRKRLRAKAAKSSVTRGDAVPEQSTTVVKQREDDEDALLEACLQEVRAEAKGANEVASVNSDAHAPHADVSVLQMREADFNVETEYRRVFGSDMPRGEGRGPRENRRYAVQARRGPQGSTAHHRRLRIATPPAGEPWPRPDAAPEMSFEYDHSRGAVFDFHHTTASERAFEKFEACLVMYDPQSLYHLLQEQPFCVDTLLALAEMHRNQSEHEQAFKLVHRALYVFECIFHPNFSPFQASSAGRCPAQPRVSLRIPDLLPQQQDEESENERPQREVLWPGWNFFRALWMYAHGLSGQGLHRTSLEVCKLMLSMTLPRDEFHVLVLMDFLCMRARRYDLLDSFSHRLIPQHLSMLMPDVNQSQASAVVQRLDLCMPNFAYSQALGAFMRSTDPVTADPLNLLGISDVTAPSADEEEEDKGPGEPHRRLMRALLYFPMMLRPLLEEAGVKQLSSFPGGSPSRETWQDLFAKPPFSNAVEFRHDVHGAVHSRIIEAFVKRAGPLWRNDAVLLWLHGCAGRLTRMHESSANAADLAAARRTWAESRLGVEVALSQDYPDLLATEGDSTNPTHPRILQRALENVGGLQARQRLMARMRAGGRGLPAGFAVDEGENGQARPNISIHSPVLLVFFQSLMPWGELDRTGVQVEPIRWKDIPLGAARIAKDVAGGVRELGEYLWALAKEQVTGEVDAAAD